MIEWWYLLIEALLFLSIGIGLRGRAYRSGLIAGLVDHDAARLDLYRRCQFGSLNAVDQYLSAERARRSRGD